MLSRCPRNEMGKDGDEMMRETSPMSSLRKASFIGMLDLFLPRGGRRDSISILLGPRNSLTDRHCHVLSAAEVPCLEWLVMDVSFLQLKKLARQYESKTPSRRTNPVTGRNRMSQTTGQLRRSARRMRLKDSECNSEDWFLCRPRRRFLLPVLHSNPVFAGLGGEKCLSAPKKLVGKAVLGLDGGYQQFRCIDRWFCSYLLGLW